MAVVGDSALVPEGTMINTNQQDYNTILKLINKIKDLEIQNIEYRQELKYLNDKVNQLATILGDNLVKDSDGIVLADIEGNTMGYATDNSSNETLKEDKN